MKNYIKAMITFVFLAVAVVVLPNSASAADLAAPTGLVQRGNSINQVKIGWNEVEDANVYFWSWSRDGVSGWSENNLDRTIHPEKTFSNLSPGSTYYVRVRAGYTFDWRNYEYGAWSQPIQVVTAPDATQMGPPILAESTSTSLTIKWKLCPGATSYQIYDGLTGSLVETVTDSICVRNGLIPNNAYSTKVVPVRTSDTGYAAFSGSQVLFGYTKPNKPAKPSIANFGLTNTYYNINVVYFGANDPTNTANGYEIEVSTVKGNKKVHTDTKSGLNRFVASRNTAYKYRCRFYATYGEEKIYGDWSDYRYFLFQTVSGKRSGSRIKLSWKKVANARSYTVLISTKEKTGYKKVKTLGKKSASLTISKFGKKKISKKKTYYVKVAANLKDGAKSVKSDTYFVGKAY